MTDNVTFPKVTFVYRGASAAEAIRFQVDVSAGPAHHGTGASPVEAFFNAAMAWLAYENGRKLGHS